jgi:hypothetical protein
MIKPALIGKEYETEKGEILVVVGELGRFVDLENTEDSTDYYVLTKYRLEQYIASGELKEVNN